MTEYDPRRGQNKTVAALTRRAAIAAVAAAPISAASGASGDAVAQLLQRVTEKNAAFMRGDMDRWSELVPIAPDFTLMQPFGGPASRGFDKSSQHLAELSRYFRNGEGTIELVQAYASEELVVLAMVERQRAEVGGLPEQDWSLRVTEVWRKAGSDWQLAHRHADPLVEHRTLEQTARIAKGVTEEGR